MKAKRYEKLLDYLLPGLLVAALVLLSTVALTSIWRMEGDARVINYTGIVRGASQRLVKRELHGEPSDGLIEKLDGILQGLAQGDETQDLIVMKDAKYQALVAQMYTEWEGLKQEIGRVRAGGDPQPLYDLSEAYFETADKAVFAAESYLEGQVREGVNWLMLMTAMVVAFIALFLLYRRRQKRLMGEVLAAENASREKSEFLSRMSHEIRTPMNGILGMTELARHWANDPEKVRAYLDKIKLSSDYLLQLINDILDMSRIESGKVELLQEPFDLRNLEDRLQTMFAAKTQDAGLDFQIVAALLPTSTVVGDELRLSQVLVNLVSNAVKFTPAQGSVRVELRQELIKPELCRVTLVVADTGIGMKAEAQERVFEPFEQADAKTSHRYGGTGLGLAISNNLVRLMGGKITLQSAPGQGSTFTVQVALRLAAEQAEGGRQEVACAAPIRGLANCRLLLAEDNELNAEIAVSLLELEGAAVDTAGNGQEAFRLFLNSAPGTYRAILMDIQMPVMDGLEACRAIRSSLHAEAKTIPIIGLSANAFEQDAAKALACGMNGYVAKPFEIDKLTAAIERAGAPGLGQMAAL